MADPKEWVNADIHDETNTSLWVTGLPGNLTSSTRHHARRRHRFLPPSPFPTNMARRYQDGGAPSSFLTAATSTSTEVTVHGDQAFRANYQGDTSRFRNLPANVPGEQNTALWLTGLPADISYPELFDNLDQRGRIFSVVINVANQASGHKTAAATITFFHAASAQKLYNFSNSGPGFFIRGNRINVLHNRRKTSEAQTKPYQTTQHGRPSRVVTISGPGEIWIFSPCSIILNSGFISMSTALSHWLTTRPPFWRTKFALRVSTARPKWLWRRSIAT